MSQTSGLILGSLAGPLSSPPAWEGGVAPGDNTASTAAASWQESVLPKSPRGEGSGSVRTATHGNLRPRQMKPRKATGCLPLTRGRGRRASDRPALGSAHGHFWAEGQAAGQRTEVLGGTQVGEHTPLEMSSRLVSSMQPTVGLTPQLPPGTGALWARAASWHNEAAMAQGRDVSSAPQAAAARLWAAATPPRTGQGQHAPPEAESARAGR